MNMHFEPTTAMTNLLPCDGRAYLIDDSGAFDWPEITRTLIGTMPWQVEKAQRFGHQVPDPRMTAWFGDTVYAYSGVVHQPAPLPPVVQKLRKRAEMLSAASFNAVLLNYYRDGSDSVGWHSDKEAVLGKHPTIASLSVGATRRFGFQHKQTNETVWLELKAGQWLIMAGETQTHWKHGVPKTKKPVGPRVNLTFRLMIP